MLGYRQQRRSPIEDKLVGQPAELSAWAYAYRADRKVQDSPEAYLVLRRLERLDQAYRPLSLLLSQESEKKQAPNPPYSFLPSCRSVGEQGAMLPPPAGVLQSALLWEGRMRLNRLELRWPASESAPPSRESVEVRVYPSPYGWFGWQRDQQVTVLTRNFCGRPYLGLQRRLERRGHGRGFRCVRREEQAKGTPRGN